MNSITTGPSLAIPPSRITGNNPSTLPAEKSQEFNNDKFREGAVSVVEMKQQKELTERFVTATVNANQNNDTDTKVGLKDLQDIAQFARRAKVVQVIDDNNGSKIKEIAEIRRDKIENLFREINTPPEVKTGQQLDSLA